MDDFDFLAKNNMSGIEYGFVKGSSTVVFIKAGLGGSLYGYENKYLKLAKKLNKLYGYSVLAASNPEGTKDPIAEGLNTLHVFMEKLDMQVTCKYYMGFSNGAYIGFTDGLNEDFKKYLLINSPLMMNFHKIKRGIQNAQGKDILIVYGDQDSSYKYAEMLTPYLNERIRLKIVQGADHQFVGKTTEFEDLVTEYFK